MVFKWLNGALRPSVGISAPKLQHSPKVSFTFGNL